MAELCFKLFELQTVQGLLSLQDPQGSPQAAFRRTSLSLSPLYQAM